MIGETLGSFELVEKLGQGGMGAVFIARTAKGDRCAVKVLAQDLSGDARALARFKHECRVLQGLEHPRIVRALSGLEETGERAYYAMELVEGEDLARRADREGAFAPGVAVAIVADVLEALAFAHERGVLHRDVKPSNVFVDREGRAKLGDFGIAFVAGATRLTRTGATLGTPEFMAPELARGDEPSVRSDLYAAGVLLFFLLEGRPPFSAPQPLAVLRKQIEESPPPLSKAVSRRLAAVVARALAKDPEERFADARSFRDELLAAAKAAAVIAALVPHQCPEETRCRAGSWDTNGIDRWAYAGGRVYGTPLNLLTLEVANRSVPPPVAAPAPASMLPVNPFKEAKPGDELVLFTRWKPASFTADAFTYATLKQYPGRYTVEEGPTEDEITLKETWSSLDAAGLERTERHVFSKKHAPTALELASLLFGFTEVSKLAVDRDVKVAFKGHEYPATKITFEGTTGADASLDRASITISAELPPPGFIAGEAHVIEEKATIFTKCSVELRGFKRATGDPIGDTYDDLRSIWYERVPEDYKKKHVR